MYVYRSVSESLQLMACGLSGSSVHGIFQQEYWSGWPFPSPGDLLNPGIEPISSALADRFFTAEPPERWGKTRRVTQIQITAFTRDRSMDSINFLLC